MKSELQIQNRRNRSRGRYGEARLAKKVGGVVVGRSKVVKLPSGKYQSIDIQHPIDVVTDMFGFESKWLKTVPKNISKVMSQAVTNCPEGLTPVAVIGDREQHTVYYVMTEKDWLALHG